MASTPIPRPLRPDETNLINLTRGLIGAMAFLSIFVCGTRLYLRKFTIKIFGFDDWVCLSALVLTQCFNGLGIAVTVYGSGKHIDVVPMADLLMWLKLYYVAMCLYLYVGLAVRVSLLVFYMRIFQKDWVQKLSYGIITFSVLFAISGSFVLAFQCNPPRAAFDLAVKGFCYSQYKLFQITLYQAVLMFATDLVILSMPLPVLWSLNMPVKRKFAVSMILMSGTVACIAPVVRFSTLDYLREGTTDLTFESTSSLYWMAIEFNLGLVAGSMSTLRRLPGLRSLGSSYNAPQRYESGSHQLNKIEARGDMGRKRLQSDPEDETRMTNGSQERIFRQMHDGNIKKETYFSVTEETDGIDASSWHYRNQAIPRRG